jgi:DNA polymerase III psi subunit
LHKETKKKGGKILKMSIDNIQLTAGLCQSMFFKSLIETNKKPEGEQKIISRETIKKPAEKSEVKSLGENKGNILFLVNNPENIFLSDEEMKLLSDLLTACKISMIDIALVNYHQNPQLNYQQISTQFQSKKNLVFGVTAADLELPFTIPFFQIQKFQDKVYMMAPPLSHFLNNVNLKKELWVSLKKIFVI